MSYIWSVGVVQKFIWSYRIQLLLPKTMNKNGIPPISMVDIFTPDVPFTYLTFFSRTAVEKQTRIINWSAQKFSRFVNTEPLPIYLQLWQIHYSWTGRIRSIFFPCLCRLLTLVPRWYAFFSSTALMASRNLEFNCYWDNSELHFTSMEPTANLRWVFHYLQSNEVAENRRDH